MSCPECGAELAADQGCKDLFHAMLGLEGEWLQTGPAAALGEATHFRAVACWGLQHPVAMGYTRDAWAGVRRSLADQLAGRADMEALRRRTRAAAQGAARVLRRDGDPVAEPGVAAWPLTVADVLAGGVAAYPARVAAWARAVDEALAP